MASFESKYEYRDWARIPTFCPRSRSESPATPCSRTSSHAASRISALVPSRRSARLSRVGVTNIVRSIEGASESVRGSPLPPMAHRRRKFWGWGYEGEGPSRDQQEQMGKTLAGMFDRDELLIADPPTIDELDLPEPRLDAPASLASQCTTDPAERAGHTYGKSFRDVVRAFRREFAHPPDAVATPRTEAEVADVLDWCAEAGAAAIPYGGGASLVGGG